MDPSYQKIKQSPLFQELVVRRSRYAWTLSIIMLAIYFGFIATIAFAPTVLAKPLFEGSVATVGFPIGIGVILSAIVLTGIYVHKANSQFDAMTRRLIEGSK